jgi:hypothetical protein
LSRPTGTFPDQTTPVNTDDPASRALAGVSPVLS